MMISPRIVTKMYDCILYLIPQVSKFPRSQRYLLGERLETSILDVFEIILGAVYPKEELFSWDLLL